MLKLHKETEFEVNYVRSRLRAMNELQAVSPVLAELASEISYKPAPITIKPAAETKPEKMAFE
jgi:ribosomal protein L20A (L18A)